MKGARQYFQRHGADELAALAGFPSHHYRHIVCIPAFDESAAFLTSLEKAARHAGGQALLILVINQPDHFEHCENNARLADIVRSETAIWQSANMSLHPGEVLDILLVDRFSEQRIPARQGVGMARKIAADIACYLLHHGHNNTFFFSSDADVIFPADYFSAAMDTDHSAAVLAFEHIPGPDTAVNQATALYQQSLHDYVHGLQRAGSPYAWHSIGSCLVIDCESYSKAHGFPRRAGAEDFYLLNKLQKLKPVKTLANPALAIQSRASSRVPFGTGPAVEKQLNDNRTASDWFYPDACFATLASWLDHLALLAEKGDIVPPADSTLQELAEWFDLAHNAGRIFANHKSSRQRMQQLHNWFDAFKTLKLLRRQRQKSMEQA